MAVGSVCANQEDILVRRKRVSQWIQAISAITGCMDRRLMWRVSQMQDKPSLVFLCRALSEVIAVQLEVFVAWRVKKKGRVVCERRC